MHHFDPPPPYTQRRTDNIFGEARSEVQSPEPASVVTPPARCPIEEELRSLPENWIRQYDPKSGYQFYVDTSKQPPRSIWHHPYDDFTYLSELSPSERLRVRSLYKRLYDKSYFPADLPSRKNENFEPKSSVHKIGRLLKDIVTSSTHEERAIARRDRERLEERIEEEAYRRNQHMKNQMNEAASSGKPQLLGRRRDGREVWIKIPTSWRGNGQVSRFLEEEDRIRELRQSSRVLRMNPNMNRCNNPYYGRSDTGFNNTNNLYRSPIGSGSTGMPLGLGLAGGLLFGGILL